VTVSPEQIAEWAQLALPDARNPKGRTVMVIAQGPLYLSRAVSREEMASLSEDFAAGRLVVAFPDPGSTGPAGGLLLMLAKKRLLHPSAWTAPPPAGSLRVLRGTAPGACGKFCEAIAAKQRQGRKLIADGLAADAGRPYSAWQVNGKAARSPAPAPAANRGKEQSKDDKGSKDTRQKQQKNQKQKKAAPPPTTTHVVAGYYLEGLTIRPAKTGSSTTTTILAGVLVLLAALTAALIVAVKRAEQRRAAEDAAYASVQGYSRLGTRGRAGSGLPTIDPATAYLKLRGAQQEPVAPAAPPRPVPERVIVHQRPSGKPQLASVRTDLSPQGYVEINGALRRATWSGPAEAWPDPGDTVEVFKHKSGVLIAFPTEQAERQRLEQARLKKEQQLEKERLEKDRQKADGAPGSGPGGASGGVLDSDPGSGPPSGGT
jgi:hypothetical protein